MDSHPGLAIVTQPILDLVSGRIAGYEALTRFRRSPPQWTSQRCFARARQCGLGPQLEAAAVDAALSLTDRPAGSYLTLNVSPSTLGTRALGAVLPGDLSGLIFELTENEPIAADPSLPSTIAHYRRRGARFALDDVGTGYATLADLHVVEPDLIKLDRSLLAGDADGEALIHAAMRTGAAVCAEGVETLAQLRWLHHAGVTCAQGYLLGRPRAGWATQSPALTRLVRRAKAPGLLGRSDAARQRLRHARHANATPDPSRSHWS